MVNDAASADAGTSGPLRRWIGRLIRWRYALLGAAVVIGVAGWWLGRGLAMDRSIENMFAADDPILVPYRRLQRTFGEHEVVLAMYADDEFASRAGVQRASGLAARLREVPGVVAAISLADIPGATDFDDRGVGARFRAMFEGYTHNEELTAAGVICLIQRPGADKRFPTPFSAMREIIDDYPHGALVGEPVLVEEAFDLLEQDGRRLNTWCTVLVLAVILACFRSVRWLALPLAVVQLTLAATRGGIVASGLQLSMVSSMLGAIVTVVGVATVVHVIVRYREARGGGLDPKAALASTMEQLAGPVAFACLTDAAGFAALMVSSVGPVQDFGLMMALGSFLVLPSVVLLTPALALFADEAPRGGREVASGGEAANSEEGGSLGHWLVKALAWSQRHALSLGMVSVVLTVVALFGSARLEVETAFTRNFRDDTRIVRQYEFVEDQFGGAGVWELLIPVPATPATRRGDGNEGSAAELPPPPTPVLMDLLRLKRELLEETPLLTSAISIADSFRAALGRFDGFGARFAISAAWGQMQSQMPEFMDMLYNVDPETGQAWIHVLLRAPEQLGAEEKTALIREVEAIARERFPGAEATGYYVLLANLIESLLADQWLTFGVSAGIVAAMMAVAFRSVPLAVATMIPNVVPVLVLFGALGWLGLPVNMGAAMIAAVSVGLSVDGSIHYIMLYQRLRRGGAELGEALVAAQNSVGRAATYATLALMVGFNTLITSDFVPTVYFGAMVSLSMVGGLIGNLLVLPVLIGLVDRRAYAKDGFAAQRESIGAVCK